MYTVYILQSKRYNRYYIGVTANLNKRLKQHNSGSNRSTKPYKPWTIIYTEYFKNKSLAWKREREIKSWKSGIKFKQLIGGVA